MEFAIETSDRLTAVDVTTDIESIIPGSLESGICVCTVQHTTAALIVQEAEPRLLEDLESFLADVVPDTGWAHDQLDGNADAHLRAALLGPSVTVPVSDGELALGTWQSILLVECDGPRRRSVTVRALPGV